MVEHSHRELVNGCYRCDIGRDEVVAIEVVDAIGPLVRRLAREAPAIRQLAVGSGYVLVKRD